MMRNLKEPPQQAPAPRENQALVTLCASTLPVLSRQLATCQTQAEVATSKMRQALAEMGKLPITSAQAKGEDQTTQLAKACENELGPLLGELSPRGVTAIRRVLGLIRQSGDTLIPVTPTSDHEAHRLSQQVQQMNTGFQALEQVNQKLTQLHKDLEQLQTQLPHPGSAPKALTPPKSLQK